MRDVSSLHNVARLLANGFKVHRLSPSEQMRVLEVYKNDPQRRTLWETGYCVVKNPETGKTEIVRYEEG